MTLARIRKALLFAAGHFDEQPSLERLAQEAGLSVFHFQRSFQRLVGISPKAYIQHLTAQEAVDSLRGGHSVLDAALSSGLSGPGRLHDLIVKVEGVTPGELARGGEDLTLTVGRMETPWGRIFAALAPRGLTYVAFQEESGIPLDLKRLWPKARFRRQDSALLSALKPFWENKGTLSCWVPASAFQLQVWRALVRVAPGERVSYQGLATRAGLKGPRAVGSAVAANWVALAIPCHRVLLSTGAVGNYHWGTDRKRALLAWESATVEA